jgi:hypothetical protein
MHCIFFNNSPVWNLDSKTLTRIELIIYNTTNGISALRKHVNINHFTIF